MKSKVMRWTTVSFGRYKGKTLPEIIVRDLDWFFWALPKLYGKLADEAQELARKAAGESLVEVGRSYNVSHSTISRLETGA